MVDTATTALPPTVATPERAAAGTARKTKLLGLEVGRFVAALLVACFHFSIAFVNLRADDQFVWLFRAGHAGVDYFFVLSGFIIYHVHKNDLGQPAKLKPFVLKRFIRLYPMYWMVFLLMIVLVLASGSLGAKFDMSIGPRILDGLLLPYQGHSLLGQSWTLRHEIVFYAVFAVAILNLRFGIGLLLVWQAACLIVGIYYAATLNPYLKPFFYIYNIGFGAGIGTAWLSARIQLPRPGLVTCAGIAGFVVLMAIEAMIGHDMNADRLPLGEVASPLLYISCASITVLGLTCWERTASLPFDRTLSILGGCSYVLYLIHGVMISILMRAFTIGPLKMLPNGLSFVLMVGLCVLAAIAVHLYVEKPTLRHLRQALLPSPKAG